MPIDTEDKRRSAFMNQFASVLPVPDADMDEGDRAQVLWVYRDFDFDEGKQAGKRGGAWMILGLIDPTGVSPNG